ncbi:hypothetical protein ALT1644_360022 [Alteromonas macleodii]
MNSDVFREAVLLSALVVVSLVISEAVRTFCGSLVLCVHPVETALNVITAIAVYILVRLNVSSIMYVLCQSKM